MVARTGRRRGRRPARRVGGARGRAGDRDREPRAARQAQQPPPRGAGQAHGVPRGARQGSGPRAPGHRRGGGRRGRTHPPPPRHRDRQPAEHLYRSAGWTRAGTIPDYAADPGASCGRRPSTSSGSASPPPPGDCQWRRLRCLTCRTQKTYAVSPCPCRTRRRRPPGACPRSGWRGRCSPRCRGRDLPRGALPQGGARRTGAGRAGEVLDRRSRGAVRVGAGPPRGAGGRGRAARHPRRLLAPGGADPAAGSPSEAGAAGRRAGEFEG